MRWLPPGAVAILTLLAVSDHLDFALAADGYFGKDGFLHLLNAVAVHAAGAHWSRIVTWYATNVETMIHYPPVAYLVSSVVAEGTGAMRAYEAMM